MTRLLQVQGRELKVIDEDLQGSVELKDGDVYVFDEGKTMWIWLGKDCSVDEKGVAAWVVNKIDTEERGGEPEVYTINQGKEPEDFKFDITVIDDDTPGFLKAAELDMVEYKLFRVYTKTETNEVDETFTEEVKLDRSSLKSDDVYVLDMNEAIYVWIGKNANREEKFSGQKLAQSIDQTRNYLPLTYTIYEGDNDKSEKSFYELLEKAKNSGPVLSVEDQREAKYKVAEYAGKVQESPVTEKKEKKRRGLFARFFGKK